MTSRNLVWERKWGGFSFNFFEDICQPTLAMHAEQSVMIRSPVDVACFHAEKNVNVHMALKALPGVSLPNEGCLLPGGNLDARVSLQSQMTAGDYDVQLFAGVSCALNIPLNSFSVLDAKSAEIVVLTKCGPYVVRRDHGMTVQDVITVVDHSFGIRCAHGQRHHKQMICPDAEFAMDIESASDDLRILQFTGISIDEGGFRFRGSFHALCEFSEFLHRIVLIDIIKSFAWLFVADAQAVIDRSVSPWVLMKKPSALAITQDELAYRLAIHMFLMKIRTWATVAIILQSDAKQTVSCLGMLWYGMVCTCRPISDLERFDEAWSDISRRFRINKPWRFVVNGRCVNPEWPLSGVLQSDELGNQELTVFMPLGLRGGGPVRFKTNEQAMRSDNFQNIAQLEAQNFEAALSVALKMMTPNGADQKRFDISDFLEI